MTKLPEEQNIYLSISYQRMGWKSSKQVGTSQLGSLIEKVGQQTMKLSLDNCLFSRHICAIFLSGIFLMLMSSGCFAGFVQTVKSPSSSQKGNTYSSRFTFLTCVNADGSEEFNVMIIGKGKLPRAFRKTTGKELGFDYYSKKTARMRTELFFLG